MRKRWPPQPLWWWLFWRRWSWLALKIHTAVLIYLVLVGDEGGERECVRETTRLIVVLLGSRLATPFQRQLETKNTFFKNFDGIGFSTAFVLLDPLFHSFFFPFLWGSWTCWNTPFFVFRNDTVRHSTTITEYEIFHRPLGLISDRLRPKINVYR